MATSTIWLALFLLLVVAGIGGMFLFGWKRRKDPVPKVAPLPPDGAGRGMGRIGIGRGPGPGQPSPFASRPPIERGLQVGPGGRWWNNPEMAQKLNLKVSCTCRPGFAAFGCPKKEELMIRTEPR